MTDVVLITVDSLRHDHVGCYGYQRDTSPNITEIANQGHQFSNVYSHAGATRPSFPSILTSSYTNMYGGYERITEERTLISEVLQENDYATAGFHSNLFLCADFGYQRGFDTFYDSKTEPGLAARLRQYLKTNLDQDGLLYTTLQKLYDATEESAGLNIGSSYVKADEITDLSVEWVNNVDSSEKFLWTHYMDVHHPYVPPEKYQLEFREAPIGNREAIKLRRKMLELPDELTKTERQDLVDLYDAEIRFTDHEIGRLISSVKETWGEDTIVIITADHGEEFYEHGQYSHNTIHDEGIHVPLIIDNGGDSAVHDEIVGLLDISPTIAEYTGCDIPQNFYGHSLKSLLENGQWDRDFVIGDYGGTNGIPDRFFYRDHTWKYIRQDKSEEIYNIDSDPDEKNNLIDENPPVLDDIRSKIADCEREIIETSGEISDVEMDDVVVDRLEKLGYKM